MVRGPDPRAGGVPECADVVLVAAPVHDPVLQEEPRGKGPLMSRPPQGLTCPPRPPAARACPHSLHPMPTMVRCLGVQALGGAGVPRPFSCSLEAASAPSAPWELQRQLASNLRPPPPHADPEPARAACSLAQAASLVTVHRGAHSPWDPQCSLHAEPGLPERGPGTRASG